MADHAPAAYEMVEVKAEDIMAERTSFYDGFMKGTTWSIAGAVAVLLFLAIFIA
ncbi:aa3-type cytochrome c oxidase subunit IV [Falsiroseomonas ponticola]|uniref:aa3-type cytochrome c oxidase subunit IV n=1 Tax=Falsiroseomonas ponticola TaxID=2786951 RepID=UPI00193249E7|nr:aa3-type cytochrome c oxidase subunit IV [Roseomonas ponticola]